MKSFKEKVQSVEPQLHNVVEPCKSPVMNKWIKFKLTEEIFNRINDMSDDVDGQWLELRKVSAAQFLEGNPRSEIIFEYYHHNIQ
jgi:hypothetical protein